MKKRGHLILQRAAALSAALCCALCFNSCSAFDLSADMLMTPPKQTEQQEEIRRALAQTLGTEAFSFRTPRSGDQQSAVFYDNLYGSPEYEAVALYALDSSRDKTRGHVLTRAEDSSWVSLCDFEITDGSVARLEFARFEVTEYAQVLVGATLYSGRENVLTVWEMETGKAESIFTSPYTRIVSDDMDDDGTDELVMFNSLADGSGTSVTLLGYSEAEGVLVPESSEILDVQFSSWLQITTDELETGSKAVFIDGRTSADTYATEVVAVVSGQLIKVLTGSSDRSVPVTCRDIDGDGSLEVPVQEILPGYAEAAASDRIPRIDWCSCDTAGLTLRNMSAVNVEWDYILRIPTRFEGQVTVVNDDEGDVWTLCMWDAEKQATSLKIFTVRSYLIGDWEEKADQHPEQALFATKDNICYTVEFYRSDVISPEELSDLFVSI